MKNVRLIILVCLVLISSIAIAYPWFFKTEGIIVTSVGVNSACKDVISVGSVIREINDKSIRNSNEFLEVTKNLKGAITLIINNNPRSCSIPENSTLDVGVRGIKTKGLKLGIDVGGGLFYLYKPEKNVSATTLQNILNVIEYRVKKYSLINTRAEIENNSIRILTDPVEEEYISYLVEQGVLEGKFIQPIKMMNNKGEFTFNDKTYEIILKDMNLIAINNSDYRTNQYLTLDEIVFHVKNVSLNTTELSMIVFNDKDLAAQESDLRTKYSRIMKQGNNYVFIINTRLSQEASKNFGKVTKGQEITISPSGESFLRDPIIITIDENPIVDLPVRGVDVGREMEELVIWGFRTTTEEATKDMLRLMSTIETKRLPSKLVLLKTGLFTSSSGEFFITLSFYMPLVTFVITTILFFVRYRKGVIVVLPLVLTILSELLIILGTITLPWFALLIFLFGVSITLIKNEIHGWLSWLTISLMLIMTIGIVMSNWVLNASSIVGVIVFVAISSSLGFIIGGGVLVGKEIFSHSEYKRSSRKIWAFTTVIMLLVFTLFFVGSVFSGAAMIIFIGLLTCVTITKPIYYSIIQKISK